jgi:hypothetical protein
MKIEFKKENISTHKAEVESVLRMLAQADSSLIMEFVAEHPLSFLYQVLKSPTAPFDVIIEELEHFHFEELCVLLKNPQTPLFILSDLACKDIKYLDNWLGHTHRTLRMLSLIILHNKVSSPLIKHIYEGLGYREPDIYTSDKLPTECLLEGYRKESDRETLLIIKAALNNRGVAFDAK